MLARDINDPIRPGTDRGDALSVALLGYRSNPYSGGQGIYLHYLSRALAGLGHSVDVISGPPYPHLVPGVRLIELPSLDLFASPNHVTALRPHHLRSFSDTFEYFSMLTGGFPEPYTFGRRLVRHFRRVKPGYDIVHDNQSLCYGTLALQRRGIPLLTTIHHPITSDLALALANAETWQARLLIKRWHSFIGMQKKVARELRHIVTVSERSRADIIEAFELDEKRVHLVYNGIDTDTFCPQPAIPRIPLRIMATASADQPLKGLPFLVRAIAALRDKYPDISLTVLGKLREGGDTSDLIDKLDVARHISFVSGVETGEIVHMYAQATVVVVPSLYEGFGFPAGEAMACGVPVISTNGGALPEVVGDAGLTVPVRDSAAIATAIERLFENPAEREDLARRGRERVLSKFSWHVATKAMLELYQHVRESEVR